jgi:opacity protein-like surface antigen
MKHRIGIGILVCGLSGIATPPAHAAGKARLFVNGAFSATSLSFDETRSFTEFAEQGTIATTYKEKTGPGFELGLQYNFSRHFGLAASFYVTSRDGSASYVAALPHPLYLDEPRSASGALSNLSYQENAGLLDVVWTGSKGRWDVLLMGGATLFKVTADLVDRIQYTQSYPYDSVSVTGTTKASFSDSPVGLNVGGGIDYRFSKRFALGAQARFARAKAKLVPSEGNSLEIDAGGLQVAAGARVYF